MENKKEHFFQRLKPLQRSVISLLSGLIVFLLLPKPMPVLIKIISCWATVAISYLSLCYIVILTLDSKAIKRKAAEEDGSKMFVFAGILISAFASFLGVFALIIKDVYDYPKSFIVGLAVTVMALSWFLVHTVFVFHYASLFYSKGVKAEGLDFPGDEAPDYMDFTYFSFCLGCTFQVSDVEITSKTIRRVALLHSLLSFALNTFVVALTINIVAGLTK